MAFRSDAYWRRIYAEQADDAATMSRVNLKEAREQKRQDNDPARVSHLAKIARLYARQARCYRDLSALYGRRHDAD